PKYEPTKAVIDAIHEAGGIAVLAHPCLTGCVDLIEDLAKLGLDGVEVVHPSAGEEEQQNLRKIASKNKLIVTGGSDFHGLYNEYPVSLGDYGIEENELHALMTYKAKQKRLQKKQEKAAAAAAQAEAEVAEEK
nr:PHP domain-containing protein [Clostridiales bacterium]